MDRSGVLGIVLGARLRASFVCVSFALLGASCRQDETEEIVAARYTGEAILCNSNVFGLCSN